MVSPNYQYNVVSYNVAGSDDLCSMLARHNEIETTNEPVLDEAIDKYRKESGPFPEREVLNKYYSDKVLGIFKEHFFKEGQEAPDIFLLQEFYGKHEKTDLKNFLLERGYDIKNADGDMAVAFRKDRFVSIQEGRGFTKDQFEKNYKKQLEDAEDRAGFYVDLRDSKTGLVVRAVSHHVQGFDVSYHKKLKDLTKEIESMEKRLSKLNPIEADDLRKEIEKKEDELLGLQLGNRLAVPGYRQKKMEGKKLENEIRNKTIELRKLIKERNAIPEITSDGWDKREDMEKKQISPLIKKINKLKYKLSNLEEEFNRVESKIKAPEEGDSHLALTLKNLAKESKVGKAWQKIKAKLFNHTKSKDKDAPDVIIYGLDANTALKRHKYEPKSEKGAHPKRLRLFTNRKFKYDTKDNSPTIVDGNDQTKRRYDYIFTRALKGHFEIDIANERMNEEYLDNPLKSSSDHLFVKSKIEVKPIRAFWHRKTKT